MTVASSVDYVEDVTSWPSTRVSPMTSDDVVRALMAARADYLSFLRRRMRSDADAEDVFQQALVKATEHAGDLHEHARLRGWFFQILRRTAADHHARSALREAKLATLGADTHEATPAEVARCACSLGHLERLRPEYADILRRVDIEEQALADVAHALGVTPNNATVRLHRARKALREHLLSFCGTDSSRACADCGCDA